MTLIVSRNVSAEAGVAARILLEYRRTLVCTRYQGRLALGAARCAVMDAFAADPGTPFALAAAVRETTVWRRLDQTTDEMGQYILGLTPLEIDAVFEAAMLIEQ